MPIRFNVILFLFAFFLTSIFSRSSQAGTWKKLYGGTGISAVTPANTTCPTGYIGVPALPPYTVRYFCVAKYEMKDVGYGSPVSQALGTPLAGYIYGETAKAACRALGARYNLISRDQWQTIARNIAGVASNWSGGTVGSGELNRGHSDNAPASALAAAVDTDPCNGTGQVCDPQTWNSQRRTHTLSNGNVIWDFAGNVMEWTVNEVYSSPGAGGPISIMSSGDLRQTKYGAATGTFCAAPSTSPYCGMGYATFSPLAYAIVRGGHWGEGEAAGVFATNLSYSGGNYRNANLGFRCVFVP